MVNSTRATFTDYSAILSVDKGPEIFTKRLQQDYNKFPEVPYKWKIRPNETTNLTHTHFTNRRLKTPAKRKLNNNTPENKVNYLKKYLDLLEQLYKEKTQTLLADRQKFKAIDTAQILI